MPNSNNHRASPKTESSPLMASVNQEQILSDDDQWLIASLERACKMSTLFKVSSSIALLAILGMATYIIAMFVANDKVNQDLQDYATSVTPPLNETCTASSSMTPFQVNQVQTLLLRCLGTGSDNPFDSLAVSADCKAMLLSLCGGYLNVWLNLSAFERFACDDFRSGGAQAAFASVVLALLIVVEGFIVSQSRHMMSFVRGLDGQQVQRASRVFARHGIQDWMTKRAITLMAELKASAPLIFSQEIVNQSCLSRVAQQLGFGALFHKPVLAANISAPNANVYSVDPESNVGYQRV